MVSVADNGGGIPEDLKQKYLTAFDIDHKWIIEAAARRQKWIDQSQSVNLWIKTPGESDGECHGGPAAGAWWPTYALGLARRA